MEQEPEVKKVSAKQEFHRLIKRGQNALMRHEGLARSAEVYKLGFLAFAREFAANQVERLCALSHFLPRKTDMFRTGVSGVFTITYVA